MEHRIKDWVEALIEIQNVMDAWLKVGVIPPSAGYSVDCFVLVMREGVYAGHTHTLLTPPPLPLHLHFLYCQVQATWLYLEPIFSSEDIMQQMPEEVTCKSQPSLTCRAWT